jgi:hypothetical protein
MARTKVLLLGGARYLGRARRAGAFGRLFAPAFSVAG